MLVRLVQREANYRAKWHAIGFLQTCQALWVPRTYPGWNQDGLNWRLDEVADFRSQPQRQHDSGGSLTTAWQNPATTSENWRARTSRGSDIPRGDIYLLS